MQHKLDFYDNHDGDEFIQYKKCKPEHKMPSASVYHMQVLHITFLPLFPLWSVMPGCSLVISDTFQLTYASCSNLYIFVTAIYECIIQLEL